MNLESEFLFCVTSHDLDKSFSSKLLFPYLKLELFVPSYWKDYIQMYGKSPDVWWLHVVAVD